MRNVILAAVLMLGTMSPLRAETFLYMAEEVGCMWCARWDADIAAIYPKTAEGQAAPLRRFDLHHDQPEDVVFARRVHYTPTFILVSAGKEVARIEGYPGEDFFWGLLAMAFERAEIPMSETE